MIIRNKKAQMKIQQMAFMLLAVTVFFIMAGLFIITIMFSGLRENAELLEERNALLLASKVADSSEFSCRSDFEIKGNCIDMDKVMALKNNIGPYRGFWGVDGLEIHKIFPANSGQTECVSENYPDCEKITLVSPEGGTGIANFVSLCRKTNENADGSPGGAAYDKCELGKIIVFYNENEDN